MLKTAFTKAATRTAVQPPRQPNQRAASQDVSFALRGSVIAAVLLNHYVDHFTTYGRTNLANTMVSVFFVLSGFGIAISLSRKLRNGISPPDIFTFYRLRAAKVFPLLWIALLFQGLVIASAYHWSAYLGYDLRGHYWFISALLECYLVSPFLFWAMEKSRHWTMLLCTVLFVGGNGAIALYPALKPLLMTFHLSGFPYAQLYLSNLYLFAIGMYFCLIKQDAARALTQSAVSHSWLTRWRDWGFSLLSRPAVFSMLSVLATVYLLCQRLLISALPFIGNFVLWSLVALSALSQRRQLTSLGGKLLGYVGRHSLSFYLLHIPVYFLLQRIGWVQLDSWMSFILCIAFLPIFWLVVIALEALGQEITRRMMPQP